MSIKFEGGKLPIEQFLAAFSRGDISNVVRKFMDSKHVFDTLIAPIKPRAVS